MTTDLTQSEQQNTLAGVLHIELHKMLARRLEFAPAPENLPAAYAVILEDLKRYGLTDADTDRLRWAFWHLGPRIDRWPTPWTIIQALPSKPEPKQVGHGICNREGQRKFIDVARAALEGKTEERES